jgi:ferrous iron transport protein B
MADEAPKFGVVIEADKVAEYLGMPVVPISAKYGQGIDTAYQTITDTLKQDKQPVTVDSIKIVLSLNSRCHQR